jgi:hypothetical protein
MSKFFQWLLKASLPNEFCDHFQFGSRPGTTTGKHCTFESASLALLLRASVRVLALVVHE